MNLVVILLDEQILIEGGRVTMLETNMNYLTLFDEFDTCVAGKEYM